MDILKLVLDRLDGPILLTKIVRRFFHLAVLPASADVTELHEMARAQARANRLNVWLYTRSSDDLHIRIPEDAAPGTASPFQDLGHYMCHPVAGRLELSPLVRQDNTLVVRQAQLVDLVDTYRARQEPELRSHRLLLPADWIMGDAMKGGTYVSAAEARELAGRGPNGLPRGLERCGVCAEVRGRCLDPDNMFFKGDRDSDRRITKLAVPVHCFCDNVNRCARCRALLALRKLNGNYFNQEDGKIWHFPGFEAFRHACLREVTTIQNVAG